MKTLILGATTNEGRYANVATKRLLKHGFEVELLGLKTGEVDGVTIKNDPNDIKDIDTVTMYVGAKNQAEYQEFLLNLHPRRVIFNPGAENETLAQLLEKQGVEVLNACTLVMLSTNQY